MLKCAESHRCEVNTLRILACNPCTFLKVSQRDSFLETRLQSLNGMTDFSKETF